MFNRHDKVQRKDGLSFSNGKFVATVSSVEHQGYRKVAWLAETGAHVVVDKIELAEGTLAQLDTKEGETVVFVRTDLVYDFTDYNILYGRR